MRTTYLEPVSDSLLQSRLSRLAVYVATLFDKLGRRTMFLLALSSGTALPTAFTAESRDNPNLAYGMPIVSIYLFGICFTWGFTPSQKLYVVECLKNRNTRGKRSMRTTLVV